MKKTRIYAAALSILLALGLTTTSCDDDKEMFQLTEKPSVSTLGASATEVVIKEENMADALLKLTFESTGKIFVNGEETNRGAYILQASLDNTFPEGKVVNTDIVDVKGANEVTLTGQQINTLTINLGMEGGATAPVYFRLAHAYSADDLKGASFSDPITVNVTSFKIYINYLLISKANETAEQAVDSLYSPNEDGIYSGFMGCSAWFGWAAWDMLGTRYATDENDPSTGTANGTLKDAPGWPFGHLYPTTVDGSNMWFPGEEGCYYVTVNTNTGNVDYVLVPALNVTGDAEVNLSFDSKNAQWTGVLTTTKANAEIKVSGESFTWNFTTGQDDGGVRDNAVKGTLALSGSDGVLTVGDGSIIVPKAGQYKIILDLNNSSKLTYKLVDMSDVKLYPTAMTANIGGQQAEMDVEMSGVLATGVYKVFVKVASAGEMTFTDGAGAVQEVKANIAAPGYYDIALNLEEGTVTVLPYGSTLTVSGGNWTGELKMNENGKYVGYLTVGEGWDITLTDENGQTYGTYKSWDQFTFGIQEGDYNHLWLEPKGNAFIEIDPANHSWTYAYENALLVISKQATIGATGSGIRTILYYDEAAGVYSGSYDNSADESVTNWNYYLQGVNATKDGFAYYGCDDSWSSAPENYANVIAEREFADASDAHTFWVDPAKKYTMSVDLANKTIVFDELVVPTKLVVYDSEKTNVVVELEAKGDGVFEGVLPAGDGWINYYIKGTADGSDKELWYGSDANWTKDDNGWANLMALNGGNLYADVTGQSLKITVNINDNSIVYAIAE